MKNINKHSFLAIFIALSFLLSANLLAFDNITPVDAYKLATSDSSTFIIDVRTPAEWKWVGHPGTNKSSEGWELSGKVIKVSYLLESDTGMYLNPSFVTSIKNVLKGRTDVTLITMCRSGKRSKAAAQLLDASGYKTFNMVTGFQGGKDSRGYRTKNGWVVDGLPYTY